MYLPYLDLSCCVQVRKRNRMDALKTTILWPGYLLKYSLVIIIGYSIAIIPTLLRVLSRGGVKSLRKFTDLFLFLNNLPLGGEVFSSIIYFFAPYSTNIGCTVQDITLKDQILSSTITMEDRPWLRNPFGSIHAIALANLGELTSGLCLTSAMQHIPLKGIPIKINIEYYKKARGRITGCCKIPMATLASITATEYTVETILTDSKGVEVAKSFITWSLKVKESKKKD